MHKFVIRCNIERFQQLLRNATDPTEIRKLRLFIAEQEAKLIEAERSDPSGASSANGASRAR